MNFDCIERTVSHRRASAAAWLSCALILVGIVLLLVTAGCGNESAEAKTLAAESAATEAAEVANQLEGVELGVFSIREVHPVDGKKSELSFHLFANVRNADAPQVRRCLKRCRHTIRDHVITATRVAPLEEFDDPQLINLRRRILVQLRRALPELVIQNVLVTEFQFSIDRV